jgi:hypothetical protein
MLNKLYSKEWVNSRVKVTASLNQHYGSSETLGCVMKPGVSIEDLVSDSSLVTKAISELRRHILTTQKKGE